MTEAVADKEFLRESDGTTVEVAVGEKREELVDVGESLNDADMAEDTELRAVADEVIDDCGDTESSDVTVGTAEDV